MREIVLLSKYTSRKVHHPYTYLRQKEEAPQGIYTSHTVATKTLLQESVYRLQAIDKRHPYRHPTYCHTVTAAPQHTHMTTECTCSTSCAILAVDLVERLCPLSSAAASCSCNFLIKLSFALPSASCKFRNFSNLDGHIHNQINHQHVANMGGRRC